MLKAGIYPGGECHISDLNKNDGQCAMKASVGHRGEVDERAGGGTHQSTLPVPVDDGLLQKGRMSWEHASMVAVVSRMERQMLVTDWPRIALR